MKMNSMDNVKAIGYWKAHFTHFHSTFLSAGLLLEFHHHAPCHGRPIPVRRHVKPHAVLQVALRVPGDPP